MSRLSFLTIVILLILMSTLSACGGSADTALAQTAPGGDPVAGQKLFMSVCAPCHGQDAKGLPGLGKNLVASEFAASKSDSELVEFITVGRGPDDPLNTTGVTMPPRGNNPDLSDEDLYHIVAYLRTLQQ
ncbi:MAG: cytochrome c [Chloroflexi bacterium]|nr:cytochrome c [Chloroflexota bacterium]